MSLGLVMPTNASVPTGPDKKGGPTPPVGTPSTEQVQSRPAKLLSLRNTILLGLYLLIVLLVLVYLLLKFWPTEVPIPGSQGETAWQKTEVLALFSVLLQISDEVRVLVIVLSAGAIGSMIHAIRSFAAFVGNRQLVASWVPWYISRPASGAALALVFYLIVRGGLLPSSVSDNGLSVPGIAGLAALVGLFSEQAILKLREVFSTLFATREPEQNLDKLIVEGPNPTPELSALEPSSIASETSELSITINGNQFTTGAEVRVDGMPRETDIKSETVLVFQLTADDVATPGDKQVTVVNPPPGGGESDPLTLTVTK